MALSETVMVGTNLVASVPELAVALIVLAVPSIVPAKAGLRAAKLNLVMSLAELLVADGVGVGVTFGVFSLLHEANTNKAKTKPIND